MATRNWKVWGNRKLIDLFQEFNSPNCAISRKLLKELIWKDWAKRMYDLKRKMWVWIVEMFIQWEFYYYSVIMPNFSKLWKTRVSSGCMKVPKKEIKYTDHWSIFKIEAEPESLLDKILWFIWLGNKKK